MPKAAQDDVAAYDVRGISSKEAGTARRFVSLEEEKVDRGMRNTAMDLDAHDVNADAKLDFEEFCELIRSREVGQHSQEEASGVTRANLLFAPSHCRSAPAAPCARCATAPA